MTMLIIGSMLGVTNSFLSHGHVVKIPVPGRSSGHVQELQSPGQARVCKTQTLYDHPLEFQKKQLFTLGTWLKVVHGHLRQTIFPAKWFRPYLLLWASLLPHALQTSF